MDLRTCNPDYGKRELMIGKFVSGYLRGVYRGLDTADEQKIEEKVVFMMNSLLCDSCTKH
jgi:hypothetical protein